MGLCSSLHFSFIFSSRLIYYYFIVFYVWALTYRFAQGLRLRQIDMMGDGIVFSSRTLTKMNSKLRALCIQAMRRHRMKTGQQLGGRHEFVMIDESNFYHKRKVIGIARYFDQRFANQGPYFHPKPTNLFAFY